MNLVSVIIPLYNQGHFLADAIHSLLSQSYKEWEAIIINDGSLDNSGEVAESLALNDSRIRVIHQKNGGLSSARNTGLRYANGNFVALLDSDDFFLPTYLDAFVSPLIEDCEIDVTWAAPQETNEILQPIKPLLKNRPSYSVSLTNRLLTTNADYRLVWDNPFVPCGQLWRLSKMRELMFDETLRSNEDWDIVCRLNKSGATFRMVHGVHALYRRHGGSLNHDFRKMIETRVICGMNNFENHPNKLIVRLARLAQSLRASVLTPDDPLWSHIGGSLDEDVDTIYESLKTPILREFFTLWCGGTIRRTRISHTNRGTILLREIRNALLTCPSSYVTAGKKLLDILASQRS